MTTFALLAIIFSLAFENGMWYKGNGKLKRDEMLISEFEIPRRELKLLQALAHQTHVVRTYEARHQSGTDQPAIFRALAVEPVNKDIQVDRVMVDEDLAWGLSVLSGVEVLPGEQVRICLHNQWLPVGRVVEERG